MKRFGAEACGGLGRGRWAGLLALTIATLLCACTHAPHRIAVEQLLNDGAFEPPAVSIDARDALAMSEAMRRYAEQALLGQSAPLDRRRALVAALRDRSGLLLDYDTERTRTAAEAYEQRAGNCLSLTLMTASFARHLGLPVHFQHVSVDEEYSRQGGLFFAVGHVNLVVGRQSALQDAREPPWLTIDFQPLADLQPQRASLIEERTVVAMYMNNRAAEAIAAGRPTEAYWWARAALMEDPRYLAGANTLGVVYTRAGRPKEAERALRFVLERDADNLHALANLSQLLKGQGRDAEAAPLAARLAQLEPRPPFWYFDRAREALTRGDYAAARDLLRRELRQQPFQHEVHFQLALAYFGLGDRAQAERHLALARDNSPTRNGQALYAGKLERLRSLGAH